jgi:tetrahydromethanopterin S-methyltransferase subunit G
LLLDDIRELQERVAELKEQLEARIAELCSIGDGE